MRLTRENLPSPAPRVYVELSERFSLGVSCRGVLQGFRVLVWGLGIQFRLKGTVLHRLLKLRNFGISEV